MDEGDRFSNAYIIILYLYIHVATYFIVTRTQVERNETQTRPTLYIDFKLFKILYFFVFFSLSTFLYREIYALAITHSADTPQYV